MLGNGHSGTERPLLESERRRIVCPNTHDPCHGVLAKATVGSLLEHKARATKLLSHFIGPPTAKLRGDGGT